MKNRLDQVYLNNTLGEWLTALAILALCLVAIRIFKSIVISSIKRFSLRTKTTWDDFLIREVERSLVPAAYVVAAYMAVTSLQLPVRAEKILHVAMTVVATFFVLRIISAIVTEFIQSFIKQRENGQTKEKQARGLVIVINVGIWLLGIVFLVDNFGYDVTALVAGLGIGGIAIALAAQTILGDLFSYFVIFFDRPFEVGDFIIVDDKMGEVEYVGVKTTRLKTLGGEQLVCSNTDLTNSRVHNYKRMQKRRVLFKLGVVYQTTHAALKEIPAMVREIIESKPEVTFDRGHFSGFGASSLDFEFVYYVTGADYNFYMDRQQSIYLDIVEAFEQRKIEFAYPTQTLFVQPNPAPAGTANN